MAPRLARSSIQSLAPKNARSKTRKRNLDAYAIASHSTASKRPVRQHRLGEYLDDAPTQKRRRAVQNGGSDDEDSVEEDVPSAPKRRRTADDDVEGGDDGNDSEGNEWRLGGMRSDDEDSDIDSDEAFGESDEEKFEGFTFRGSKSSGTKTGKKVASGSNGRKEEKQRFDMDLDEDDDDGRDGEEDGFGDEGVDLATMLDDDASDEEDPEEDGDSDEDEESDNDSTEESYLSSDDDDGQDDEERAARLRDRVDALNKSTDTKTTRFDPSAFSLDDLIAPAELAAKQQTDGTRKAKKKSSRPMTEAAPLPKRQQDRLNREVATQKAKEQLDRWRDTVIQNRRAEFLSFPLKHNDEVDPLGKDKFIVDNVPQTDLEKRIQSIMEESGLSSSKDKRNQTAEEDAILAAEGLATNALPVEEVMRRRAELRRTRELLFREERKARRIAKIKSKAYRRVHRKERERQAQLEEGLKGSDDDEDEREANDRKRAMARMSTKHRDSKFAKALKEANRSVWDEGAREAVLDEARRREELDRRIRGDDVVDGSEGDSAGEDDADWDGFGGDELESVSRQLDRLKDEDGTVHRGPEGKGLQNMKFMRAADEQRKAQNEEELQRLKKEFATQDGDEESDEGAVNDQGLGRAVFGPKASEKTEKVVVKRGEMEEAEESVDEGGAGDGVDVITETPTSTTTKGTKPPRGPLANDKQAVKKHSTSTSNQKPSEWIVDPPANGKIGGQTGKSDWLTTKTNKGKALTTEPIIDIGLPKPHANNTAASASASAQMKTNGIAPEPAQSYHTRAFAGDDVAASFAAEKAALAAEEDEQETSSHLPGWGSWTGAGLSKSLRRANAKAKHNPLFKTKTLGVRPENRKDKGRDDVIVSEKQMRKGKGRELLASVLPRGFETREQYERSLRVPVGPEWTTKEVLQRSTRPRVVVQRGAVVEALERPMV